MNIIIGFEEYEELSYGRDTESFEIIEGGRWNEEQMHRCSQKNSIIKDIKTGSYYSLDFCKYGDCYQGSELEIDEKFREAWRVEPHKTTCIEWRIVRD